jgi:nicotinate-nucleotide pyrophosphorylase (carboxylating)
VAETARKSTSVFKLRQARITSMFLPREILADKLRGILAEDIGQGDITTELLIPPKTILEAQIISRERGIAAGLEEAKIFWESLRIKVQHSASDGDQTRPGKVLMVITGDARTILSAERTVLNILSRMSGIATSARNVLEKLRSSGAKAKVACTRKTAPGLLYFDKKAVLVGGGDTHRLHLDDMILIKDNHIAVAGGVQKAVEKAREKASFSKKVEVEVARAEDALIAVRAGADIVMLDNFSPEEVKRAVVLLKKEKLYGKALLEASGGITTRNVVEFATAGIDMVSLGEITQSAKALSISLEVSKVKKAQPKV